MDLAFLAESLIWIEYFGEKWRKMYKNDICFIGSFLFLTRTPLSYHTLSHNGKGSVFFLQNLIWSSFGFCAFSSSVCRTYLWSHYNALEENVNLIYTLNTHLSNSRILLIYPRYVSGQCFLGELMVEMGRLI